MRMLLDNSLLVSSIAIAGLWLAWIAKRERDVARFKETVAAEALFIALLAEVNPNVSVERNLWINRRIPRERWGWWKRRRRWWTQRRVTEGRLRHFRLAMLSRRPDGSFDVFLMWEAAASRLEVISKIARLYECDAPDDFLDAPDEHLIWPMGTHGYLIVEPTSPRRHWRRRNAAHPTMGVTEAPSKTPTHV